MSNLTVTNNDLGSVILRDAQFEDDLLTFGGAGTEPEGTILARDSVSKKLIPFVKGGSTNEDGIPKAILTFDVTATGAGDEAIRAAISGEFRKERLIIKADGDDSNIDKDVRDDLRAFGMVAVDVEELNIRDNQ